MKRVLKGQLTGTESPEERAIRRRAGLKAARAAKFGKHSRKLLSEKLSPIIPRLPVTVSSKCPPVYVCVPKIKRRKCGSICNLNVCKPGSICTRLFLPGYIQKDGKTCKKTKPSRCSKRDKRCPVQRPVKCDEGMKFENIKYLYKFKKFTVECKKTICCTKSNKKKSCPAGERVEHLEQKGGPKCRNQQPFKCVKDDDNEGDDENGDNDNYQSCKMPKCRPATDGCKYVEDLTKKENGCPRYPCGRMECEADGGDDDDENETEDEAEGETEDEAEGETEEEDQSEEQADPQNLQLCPMPICMPAAPGCEYVKDNTKNKNGCPKYPCGRKKCRALEEEDMPDMPCKNVICTLALCQPGQTTVPANPTEGKCCNSCEGVADLSVKCDHVKCSIDICKPGQTTVFADPKKGRCCDTCEGQPDETLQDGPEEVKLDDDEIDDNYKIIGDKVYCLAPSTDDAIEHQHAEMVKRI